MYCDWLTWQGTNGAWFWIRRLRLTTEGLRVLIGKRVRARNISYELGLVVEKEMAFPVTDALDWLLKLESHAPAWAEATVLCVEAIVVLHVPVSPVLALERVESLMIVHFVSGLGDLVCL